MKKKWLTAVVVAGMALTMSLTAFAGSWKKDAIGWWYDNENGTYLQNGWSWVDGNRDGVAECYYFENSGYILTGTTTPDGYQVNGDGAWTENGVVQTKQAAAAVNESVFSKSGSKKGLATRDTLFSNTSVSDLGVKHIIYNFTNFEQNFMDNFRNTKAHGVSVTAIMLNTPRNNPEPQSLPAGITGQEANYYGFNVTSQAGIDATTRLANRFASLYKDSIDNWVIGNEINYPNAWNYTPHSSLENYADQYAHAFRIWYTAIKQNNPSANVYIPFDYVWTEHSPSGGYYKAKDLLRLLNDRLRDLDYGIAWHPYPQELADPNFEDDAKATNSEDSLIINMKNINVLTDYLQKPEYLSPNGKVRHLILSEQGFNATNEDIQADQIAKAYNIAKNNPYIEAFFLAREYDQPGEMHNVNGALQEMHFGLKEAFERGGRPRKAYSVYKSLQ